MGLNCTTAGPSKELPMRNMEQQDLKSLSLFSKIQNVEKKCQSTLKLEGRIKTNLPDPLKNKFAKYGISYKLKYGKQKAFWHELSESLEYLNHRTYSFDYIINLSDQTIDVEIEFRPKIDPASQNRNKSFTKEERKSSIEEMDNNFIIIKLKAVFDVHDLLMGNGQFLTPKKIDDSQLKASLSGEEIKVDPFQESPPLMMSLVESKPNNLKKIRFSMAGRFNKKAHLMITIYEMVGNNRKFIYETLPTQASNTNNALNYFEPVEINTDCFEDDMVSTKIIELEAKEVKFDSNDNRKIKPL